MTIQTRMTRTRERTFVLVYACVIVCDCVYVCLCACMMCEGDQEAIERGCGYVKIIVQRRRRREKSGNDGRVSGTRGLGILVSSLCVRFSHVHICVLQCQILC